MAITMIDVSYPAKLKMHPNLKLMSTKWMISSIFVYYLLSSSILFKCVISDNNSEDNGDHGVHERVVYAINAGGNESSDSHGIVFQKDPATSGFVSKFEFDDKVSTIERVTQAEDLVLYQTARFGRDENSFGYDIPIKGEGSYVLVMRFCELAVRQRKINVFDVMLNDQHKIVSNLDILAKAGFATAHQEVIPFHVEPTDDGPVLEVEDGESYIEDRKIRLDFVNKRGMSSLNALYVIRGTIFDVPPLPKLGSMDIKSSEIVYAVNCGGEAHTDIYGITYQADPSKVGIASSHGMVLDRINRVHQEDMILYRTERYSTSSFGYNIPVKGDGSFVLVMKFSEVWFQREHGKIFDVALNHRHTIVSDLDIFAQVGWGTAHDVVVPFTIKDKGKTLALNGEKSQIKNGQIYLEFIKGEYDNPKINAFYVIRGTPKDVPPMPSLPRQQDSGFKRMSEEMAGGHFLNLGGDQDEFDDGDWEIDEELNYNDFPTRNIHDPWENESLLSMFFPLIVSTLVAFGVLTIICFKFRP